jgi:DNA-binding CsgD family transcriptional regulator
LLGIIAWIIGDFSLARLYTEQGLAGAKTLDDRITYAYLLDLLGQIALDQGDDHEARTVLEEGLAVHRQAGDTLGSLNALFFLERTLCALDDMSTARSYAEEHLALSRAIGFQIGGIGALIFLGRLALEEGNASAARAFFEEGMALLYDTGEDLPLAVATNLQGIGVTLAKIGRAEDAVRLWAAASSFCAFIPEERALSARWLADTRAGLGVEAFAAAWAEGRAMTLERALAVAGRTAYSIPPSLVPQVTARIAGAHQSRWQDYELTQREAEVLRLVAQGLSDAQLAEALVISPRTVNAHLRSIYRKLHISSRHQATYFALEHGLI